MSEASCSFGSILQDGKGDVLCMLSRLLHGRPLFVWSFLSPVVGGRSGDVYREHERAKRPVRAFAIWCRRTLAGADLLPSACSIIGLGSSSTLKVLLSWESIGSY